MIKAFVKNKGCPKCEQVKVFIKSNHIPVDIVDAETDEGMLELISHNTMSVPSIFNENNEQINVDLFLNKV